jgi:hypothetical protein
MDFKAPFSQFFKSPEYMKNWLFMALCFLIPVVGPIVATGWLVRCLVAWIDEHPYPDFDFQFFGDYLKQGLWPFLVSMVVSMILMILFLPVILLVFFQTFAFLEDAPSGGDFFTILLLIVLIVFAELLLITVIAGLTTPSIIRSALQQDFSSGFSIRFIMDFLKRCWRPLLVTQAVLMILWAVGIFVGYLALFIGIYFTMTLLTFVQWHLHFQVYRSYLESGGQGIPIHPSLRPTPPPPMPEPASPPTLPAD